MRIKGIVLAINASLIATIGLGVQFAIAQDTDVAAFANEILDRDP